VVAQTKEQILIVAEAARYVLARRSFLDFLPFVKVQDPPPGVGIHDFEMWPYLVQSARDFVEHDRIVWPKPRQIGATTLAGAFSYHICYQDYANVLLFSQGEVEAQEFLSKVKLIGEHLPPELRLRVKADSKSMLEFENGSRVRALPSTTKAGHGETASLVIMDEADFHEHFSANYAAVTPTIDRSPGAKLFIISKSNPHTIESPVKTMVRQAPKNRFHRVGFYGWDVVPGRTERWLEERRAESLDPVEFQKNYPKTLEEYLAAPDTLASFDKKMLEFMEQFVQPPVETDGVINIYQHRRVGGRYMVGTDTSHGVGADYSVSVVMERDTGTIVADILDNTLEPQGLAFETIRMLQRYNRPLWGIEDNEWGKSVLDAALAEYPKGRIFHRTTAHGTKYPGWHTDGSSRWILWGDLKAAVLAGQIRIPNKDGLAQFQSVIRNPAAGGRDEAMSGSNDDYPTAVGIAWQMRKQPLMGYGSGQVVAMPASY